MSKLVFLLVLMTILIAFDTYAYYGMVGVFKDSRYYKVYKFLYLGISVLSYVGLIVILLYYPNKSDFGYVHKKLWVNTVNGFLLSVLVSKLLFISVILMQDIGRMMIGLYHYISSHLNIESTLQSEFVPERRKFISQFGTFIAAVPFFSLLYGTTRGKYFYKVQEVTLYLKNLPKSFENFKIVQISDVHAGSFDDKDSVRGGIEMINELEPDIVCFTGDLVNNEKEEIDPYIDIFAEIKSKYGKFAVLGNHDYWGSYDRNSQESSKAYFDDFFGKFKKMGFQLLNNQAQKVSINGESIQIIGVENWGAGRYFPKEGDLDLAAQGIDTNLINILLSHDPTYWDEKIKTFEPKIDLTLSGHTHGFQFGVQFKNFKWSPAQYRYKKWLGLYEENDRYLYVNRGFGFLAFPGRVGMWPEITSIVLKRKEDNT